MSEIVNNHEPEETIEAAIVTRLSSACTIPVEGVLAPVATGKVKRLSADTFVGVSVDLSSQDGDYTAPMPLTFSAAVKVHFAQCDDADGSSFRDECRRVRSALVALCGDGCSTLDVAGKFACDAFTLNSTSTDFEAGDNPVFVKAYTATLKGRSLINTTEA